MIKMTTLCYIEKDDCYLMLHRVSKKNDANKDKWIGIGGHFEEGESPEDCLFREAWEETGLTLTSWRFRGIVTFVSDEWPTEYMFLYTADDFKGEMTSCQEGTLEWVKKEKVTSLNLWEGDKIFLRLLADNAPFFSLKLTYKGEVLSQAVLDGKELELFDICDEHGEPTGKVTERSVAHSAGIMHRTAHIWICRNGINGPEILLQKRSLNKASFPGMYDISAAGHAQAGDSLEITALRELEEELGIQACPEELTKLGMLYSGDVQAVFNGRPFHDREMTCVFLYQKEIHEDQLILQEEEVDSVRWFPLAECIKRGEARQAVRPLSTAENEMCVNPEELYLIQEYLEKQ